MDLNAFKSNNFFRLRFIDYVNMSKFLDNDMSRCECTGGVFEGDTGFPKVCKE